MKRLWSILFVTVCLLIPVAVSAHAKLVESNPADGDILDVAPSEIVMIFDSELNTEGASITVTNADGISVDQGDSTVDLADVERKTLRVSLQSDLSAGDYTATWTVIGDDGHEVTGSISFSVAGTEETPAPTPEPEVESAPAEAAPTDATLPTTGSLNTTAVWFFLIPAALLSAGLLLRRRQEV